LNNFLYGATGTASSSFPAQLSIDLPLRLLALVAMRVFGNLRPAAKVLGVGGVVVGASAR